MKKYKEFYMFMILESIFQVHDNFKEIINKISDDPVANKLLSLFGKDLKLSHNFLQKGDDNDQVYFLPDNQAQKVSDPWVKKNAAKVGRLVNQLLTSQGINVIQSDMEKFINRYKTAWKESLEVIGKDPILLVKGDDIRYWYDFDNYGCDDEEGALGNSCMRYKRCQGYFRIYTENPDVCQLAILLDEDDKLIGRCLVWLMEDGRTYIDRIYTRWDNDVEFIHNFLKKKYPNSISHYNDDNDSESIIVKFSKDYSDEFKKKEEDITLEFPYMDSLMYFYPLTSELKNIDCEEEDFCVGIQSTSGGFSRRTSITWSEYEKDFIDTDNGYVYLDDDWVPKSIVDIDVFRNYYKKGELVHSDLYNGLISNPIETEWGLAPSEDMASVDMGDGDTKKIPGIFYQSSGLRSEDMNDIYKYPIYDWSDGGHSLVRNLKKSIDSTDSNKYISNGFKLNFINSNGFSKKLCDMGSRKFLVYYHEIYPIGISNIIGRWDNVNSDFDKNIYLWDKWLESLGIELENEIIGEAYIKRLESYKYYLTSGISSTSNFNFLIKLQKNKKSFELLDTDDIILRNYAEITDQVKDYIINYINNLCEKTSSIISTNSINVRYDSYVNSDVNKKDMLSDPDFIQFTQKILSKSRLGYYISEDIRKSKLIGKYFPTYRDLDNCCDSIIEKIWDIISDDDIIIKSISYNLDNYDSKLRSMEFNVKLFD